LQNASRTKKNPSKREWKELRRIKRLLSKQLMTAKINLKLKIDRTSTFKNSGTLS